MVKTKEVEEACGLMTWLVMLLSLDIRLIKCLVEDRDITEESSLLVSNISMQNNINLHYEGQSVN